MVVVVVEGVWRYQSCVCCFCGEWLCRGQGIVVYVVAGCGEGVVRDKVSWV